MAAFLPHIKLSSNTFHNELKISEVLNLGNYEMAIETYDKAIEINPEYETAWIGKGQALEKLGNYDLAIEAYDKAIEIDSQDLDIWTYKRNVLDRIGRHEEAVICYNKTLEIMENY